MNDPVRPSRHLNERAGFFGLSVFDCAGLAYILVALSRGLEGTGYSFFAFIAVGIIGVGLVGVRMRFRRKTIRDWLRSKI